MPEDFFLPGERAQDRAWVVEFCRSVLIRTGTDGLAVSLLDSAGNLEPVLETDAVAEEVSTIQFTLGEGPGHDCAATGEPVLIDTLDSVDASRRWPGFTPQVVALGVGAVHVFPVGAAGMPLGSALHYRREPRGMDADQLRQAQAVNELLRLVLMSPDQRAGLGSGMRMIVHQAAGMVMQQTGGNITDALVLLKTTAFSENKSVTDLAADVVAGRRRFTAIARRQGEPQ